MKKQASALALAIALSTGAALAADLPSHKGPVFVPPPPPPLWTGFYAGLNSGYDFGTNDGTQNVLWNIGAVDIYRFGPGGVLAHTHNYDVPFGNGNFGGNNGGGSQDGFVGGGQIGYNYQWGSKFVIGLEFDIQGAGIRGTSSGVGLGGFSQRFTDVGFATHNRQLDILAGSAGAVQANVDWLSTIRGRFGYLFTPTTLLFATGGLTIGGVRESVSSFGAQNVNDFGCDPTYTFCGSNPAGQLFFAAGNRSETRVGWNVGGGVEWMFMPGWSLKAEAIYWDLGHSRVDTFGFGGPQVSPVTGTFRTYNQFATVGSAAVDYQGVMVRAGVNYHFNWGAPAAVLAKY